MKLRSLIGLPLKRALSRAGYHLVPNSMTYDWQRHKVSLEPPTPWTLPEESQSYLVPDSLRLCELRDAYLRFGGAPTKAAVWTADYVQPEHLKNFRGENGYVWQIRERNQNELGYILTYYYTKSKDALGLLDKLAEDEAFGANVFVVEGGRQISRDLLDSVNELNFLERHLNVSRREGAVVVDIGAGYGRLAYRAVTSLPSISKYICTDAVAQSTFVCEHYLRFRRVHDRAVVVPLDRIEGYLRCQPVDIAVNIHSWSECSLDAIQWWVTLLKRSNVAYLMVIPNRFAGSTMLTNGGENFSRILLDTGYELVTHEPKYADPLVQKYGISPASYFLWKLT